MNKQFNFSITPYLQEPRRTGDVYPLCLHRSAGLFNHKNLNTYEKITTYDVALPEQGMGPAMPVTGQRGINK